MTIGRKAQAGLALTLLIVAAIAIRLELHNRQAISGVNEVLSRTVTRASHDSLHVQVRGISADVARRNAAHDSVYIEVRNLTRLVCQNPRLPTYWQRELRCLTR